MKVEQAETQPSYFRRHFHERALHAIQQRQELLIENDRIVETTRSLVQESFKTSRYDKQSLCFLEQRHKLIMAIREGNIPSASPLERLKRAIFLEKLNQPNVTLSDLEIKSISIIHSTQRCS